MRHHVIYIPGITDDAWRVERLALKLWVLHGLHGHLHTMPWAGAESYESKHARLLAHIDEITARGHAVSLVGVSAGASGAINAYVERKDVVAKLVYICGKINYPEAVGQKVYDENPAFRAALTQLQDNLLRLTDSDKARMLSLYAKNDSSVPYEHTIIPGVAERQLAVSGHARGIVVADTVQSYLVARFLKS